MRNALYGVLCGVLTFGLLSWARTERTVHAAVLATPPEGRFQLVQLHPSSGTEWSAILDTETGCTWVYASIDADDPKITEPNFKGYLKLLGHNAFELENFDPVQYTDIKLNSDNTVSYAEPIKELVRVQAACSQARLQALSAAGSR